MTDQLATTEPATPAPAPATPAPPPETATDGAVSEAGGAGAVSEAPDWRALVDQLDHKDLRSHPKVAGIVGAMVNQAMRNWERERGENESRQATERARTELRQMAKDDPVAFAERYLNDDQRDIALGQIEQLRRTEIGRMSQRIGQALHTIPGWAELTVDDHTELAKAIQGLSDDETFGPYAAKALELLAKRQIGAAASERFEQWKKSELAKEREAIRAEVAADLLKKEPKPDMTKGGKGPSQVEMISKMSDEDFDKFWNTQVLGQRG